MNALSSPMVSVVVPAYNASKFLAETLDSVLLETYSPLEVIVVNDGSKDDTLKIATDYALRDTRVVVIDQPNGGVCRARNHGIQKAKGKYILPVDSDDILLPGFIEWAVLVMEQDTQMKAVVPKAEFFGARTGPWSLKPFSKKLLARKNMIPATALYRKIDWERCGGYYEGLQAREDWEFWISVLKNGGQVCTSPQLALRYRIHPESKRTADRRLKKQVIDALNERHPEFFQRELGGPLRYNRTWSECLNTIHRLLNPSHLVLHDDYKPFCDFFKALPSIFKTSRGEIIYNRRNQLRRISYAGKEFVVKSYHKPHLINQLAYGLIRPTKARRSYEYAMLLRSKGIGSPMPVAHYTERFLGLFLGRSYYVSELSECPYTYNDIISGRFNQEDETKILKAIALITARMHDEGMVHRDYSRGNILFGKEPNGEWHVQLIDLNRIRFHKVDVEEGCRNFAERLPATDSQRYLMAETYAHARGFNASVCYELMCKHNKEKD